VDLQRIGVAGISMGGSLALVLAWQQKRITAVAALVGAGDFWWDVTKTPPGPEQEAKKRGYSQRVRRLVDSIDPWPRVARMQPKAVFVASGRTDHFIDVASMRGFADRMRALYASCRGRFRFLEEEGGHGATPSMRQEATAWFTRFLKRDDSPKQERRK
jgi:acetyl esterase/lipase